MTYRQRQTINILTLWLVNHFKIDMFSAKEISLNMMMYNCPIPSTNKEKLQ